MFPALQHKKVRRELNALFKACATVLGTAGTLAVLSNLPSGPSRNLTATVIPDTKVTAYSHTTNYVTAQLHNGSKVPVRLKQKTTITPGQTITITEHQSLLDDTLSYELVETLPD